MNIEISSNSQLTSVYDFNTNQYSKTNKYYVIEYYCICKNSNIEGIMIQCDLCNEWYHIECIGKTEEEIQFLDEFCCSFCL